MIYEAINEAVILQVPKAARRILDLGCGSGNLDRRIKQVTSCEIVGITYSAEEATLAAEWVDQVLVCDLNDFEPSDLGKFDCIVCSHVLEHLYRPDRLLARIRGSLLADGILIVALPNILHWKQRMTFLKGRFEYTNGGLMDSTHYRFFDWKTARQLIEEAGFTTVHRSAEGVFPLPIIRRLLGPLAEKIDRVATSILPGLFGAQFIIVARSTH